MSKKTNINSSSRYKWYQVLFLLFLSAVVILIYSNTLYSPFHLDDDCFIVKDKHIRMVELTWEGIKEAAFEGAPKDRLLPNISFAVNYYLDRHNLIGYHVFNMLIHIVAGGALFFFFKITHHLATRHIDDSKNYALIPFFATLIWIVHPVHTQSVTYISQRMTSMAAMFYIISFLFYVKGRILYRSDKSKRLKAALLFISCLVTWLCAVTSKENAATLPLFILLYEWFFFHDLKHIRTKKNILLIAGAIFLAVFLGFIYLDGHPIESILSHYGLRDFTPSQRVMTEFRVVVYYISLFFYPHPGRLTLEHGYPLSFFLIDPWTTMLSLAAIIGLIFLSLKIAKKDRLVSFCILWFFGNLAIESSIIGLEIIFEHRTYLPFMMVSLLLTILITRIVKCKSLTIVILCGIVAICSGWTYQRNAVWRDEVSFWQDCVNKTPNEFRSHNNLGIALYRDNQFQNAIEHYKKALQLDPVNRDAKLQLNNIGSAMMKIFRTEEAIPYFLKALQLDSNFVPTHINLGRALMQINQYKESIHHFSIALQHDPENIDAHQNISFVFLKIGSLEQAYYHFLKILQLDPYNSEANINLANILSEMGNLKEAVKYYSIVLDRDPDNVLIYNNLGNTYVRMGDMTRGIQQYAKALTLSPDNLNAQKNLEAILNLHLRTLPHKKAIDELKRLSTLYPYVTLFHQNLGNMLIKKR